MTLHDLLARNYGTDGGDVLDRMPEGGAEERQERYVALVQMMMKAGPRLHYPGDSTSNAYIRRLLDDAIPQVAEILRLAGSAKSDHPDSKPTDDGEPPQ